MEKKNMGPKQPKPKYAGSIRKYCRANAIEEWYFLCGCGRKGVNFYDYRPCIQCDVCKLWKHVKCVGFPEDVFKLANEMRKRRVWVCSDCKSGNFHFVAKIWNVNDEPYAQQILSVSSPLDETTKTIEENEEYEKKLAERKDDRRKQLKRMPTAFDSEYAKVEELDMDKILSENYDSTTSPRSPKKHVFKSPPPEVSSKSSRRRKSAVESTVKVVNMQKSHSECIPLSNSMEEKNEKKKERREKKEPSIRIEKESKKKKEKKKREREVVEDVNNNSNDDSLKIDSDNSTRDEIKIEEINNNDNDNNVDNNEENNNNVVIENIEIVVSLHDDNNNNDNNNNDIKEKKNKLKFADVIIKITPENSPQRPHDTSEDFPKKSILKTPTPQFLEPTPPPLSDYLNDPGNVIFQESFVFFLPSLFCFNINFFFKVQKIDLCVQAELLFVLCLFIKSSFFLIYFLYVNNLITEIIKIPISSLKLVPYCKNRPEFISN